MIEARTVTAANAAELAEWCGGRLVTEKDALDSEKTQPGINVPVGSSDVERASMGDVILKSGGIFYVQKQ